MARPNVNIVLGNGNLGRSSVSDDGVAALVLTGTAVSETLALNKHYQLAGTADLVKLGITAENNPLVYKEVTAFYEEAGDGAELHLLVVAEATTFTQMCDSADGSPLRKLIDASGGRVRIAGVNRIPPLEYEADVTQGIDKDAIDAAAKAQAVAESFAAGRVAPFRLLMPAPALDPDSESLFKPREASYNAVAFVLASDDATTHTAAIGRILGRAASLSVHQSLGRVRAGAIATEMYLTDGQSYTEADSLADMLHDAGYIIPICYPRKNGAYLNGDPMAAPVTDDYSQLRYGRVIDKARIIIYDTLIDEVLDNVESDDSGNLSAGQCVSYASMIENAVMTQMDGEITAFNCTVPADQNILSSEKITVICQIQPIGVVETFEVTLEFTNPALNSEEA